MIKSTSVPSLVYILERFRGQSLHRIHCLRYCVFRVKITVLLGSLAIRENLWVYEFWVVGTEEMREESKRDKGNVLAYDRLYLIFKLLTVNNVFTPNFMDYHASFRGKGYDHNYVYDNKNNKNQLR